MNQLIDTASFTTESGLREVVLEELLEKPHPWCGRMRLPQGYCDGEGLLVHKLRLARAEKLGYGGSTTNDWLIE